jgi:hypothetical protein
MSKDSRRGASPRPKKRNAKGPASETARPAPKVVASKEARGNIKEENKKMHVRRQEPTEAAENLEVEKEAQVFPSDKMPLAQAASPPAAEARPEVKTETRPPIRPESRPENRSDIRNLPPPTPVADFLLQSYFDKSVGRWVATVAEFPELKVEGSKRETVLEELETKLEDEIEILRRRGESIPESLYQRHYPEHLELMISPTLYRRLDVLSRQERIPLENLVTELLSSGIERRYIESQKGGRPQQQQQQQQHQGERRHQHQHQQRHGGGGGGGNLRGRNYHDNMDKSDNFLEYVRNLEKGGGGKWRK